MRSASCRPKDFLTPLEQRTIVITHTFFLEFSVPSSHQQRECFLNARLAACAFRLGSQVVHEVSCVNGYTSSLTRKQPPPYSLFHLRSVCVRLRKARRVLGLLLLSLCLSECCVSGPLLLSSGTRCPQHWPSICCTGGIVNEQVPGAAEAPYVSIRTPISAHSANQGRTI